MVFTTLVYLAFAANVASLPPGKGKAIVQRDCKGCHALKVITSKRASREQWSTLVDQMVSRGADVPDEEIETVVDYLIENDLIAKPYWMQTVMGYQTGSFPTVENIIQLLKEFPDGALWLCSAIGPFQLPLTTLATLMGGHVRVGLEDNVYYSRGRKAKSNAELVERTVRIAHELNRPVATPAQARAILGLPCKASQY